MFYPKSQFSDKILPGFARWHFKDIYSKVNDFIVDAIDLIAETLITNFPPENISSHDSRSPRLPSLVLREEDVPHPKARRICE